MNEFYRATDYHNDFLVHSGVKGMRWYERRYQNYDGSLTPLGRIHYGVGEPIRARLTHDGKRAYIAKRKMQKHNRVVSLKKAKKLKEQVERKTNKIARTQQKTQEKEIKRQLKEAEDKAKEEKKAEQIREKYMKRITETGDPALVNKYKKYLTNEEINAANERFKALQNVHLNRVTKAKRAGDYLNVVATYTKSISDMATNIDNTYKQFNQLKDRVNGLKKKVDEAEKQVTDSKPAVKEQKKEQFLKKADEVDKKYEQAQKSTNKLLDNLKEKQETAKKNIPSNEQKMKEYRDRKDSLLKQIEASRKAENDKRVDAYYSNKADLLNARTRELLAKNQARIDDYNRTRQEAEYLLKRMGK